jgi:hypothetical protein
VSAKPFLHPDSIEAALIWLRSGADMPEPHRSACISALKLIKKSQRTVGLTAARVDVAIGVKDLVESMKRLL